MGLGRDRYPLGRWDFNVPSALKGAISEIRKGWRPAYDKKMKYFVVVAPHNGIWIPVLRGCSKDNLIERFKDKLKFVGNPSKGVKKMNDDKQRYIKDEFEKNSEDAADQVERAAFNKPEAFAPFYTEKRRTDGKGPNGGTKYYGKVMNR